MYYTEKKCEKTKQWLTIHLFQLKQTLHYIEQRDDDDDDDGWMYRSLILETLAKTCPTKKSANSVGN